MSVLIAMEILIKAKIEDCYRVARANLFIQPTTIGGHQCAWGSWGDAVGKITYNNNHDLALRKGLLLVVIVAVGIIKPVMATEFQKVYFAGGCFGAWNQCLISFLVSLTPSLATWAAIKPQPITAW